MTEFTKADLAQNERIKQLQQQIAAQQVEIATLRARPAAPAVPENLLELSKRLQALHDDFGLLHKDPFAVRKVLAELIEQLRK